MLQQFPSFMTVRVSSSPSRKEAAASSWPFRSSVVSATLGLTVPRQYLDSSRRTYEENRHLLGRPPACCNECDRNRDGGRRLRRHRGREPAFRRREPGSARDHLPQGPSDRGGAR